MEEHLPEMLVTCEICGVDMSKNSLEEHTKKNHDDNKIEQQCEICPKSYTSQDQIKRHIWRAHTETECNLCDLIAGSRQDLKHHKENVHRVTKEIECKYAKEGKCIDEEECLFHHVKNQSSETLKQSENKAESILKVKCDKCPQVYKTLFEVKRHKWRSHEQVDCRRCGQASGSREDLENHKKNKHGITKLRVCKFWANNKCVDSDECLFRHEGLTNNAEGTHIPNKHTEKSDIGRQLYCKVGLKCTRQC